ncbi:MAG: c-type cytochrome [Luteolibacter sp.]
MSSSKKPDLEETINVAEAHERVDRELAAAAREKRIDDQGSEPITLWVLALCGIVAVIAGGILGAGGQLFAYGETFPQNYVRAIAPGEDSGGPLPKPVLDAMIVKGAKVYSVKCNGCHQGDAKGNNNFPSLVGSDWVMGDTDRLAMIILNGLKGPISTGKSYPGGMPAQLGLAPEDLASVMTYIRNNFGNNAGDVVSVEMAKAALEISGSRAMQGQVTGEELLANHAKPLPGEILDPTVLVNPVTLVPTAAATP